MKRQWQGVAALAIGAIVIGTGSASVSASSGGSYRMAHPASIVSSASSGIHELARMIGVQDDETPVAAGTIDDGEELLSQTTITLDQAIAAAQAAESGALGEVDLEYYQGTLVFNIDIGAHDVKVDAATGEVLGSVQDD